eukprot:scaffold784_cov257-Chaetoceros_neogracile.AAC.3
MKIVHAFPNAMMLKVGRHNGVSVAVARTSSVDRASYVLPEHILMASSSACKLESHFGNTRNVNRGR